ncbi:MAG TPA: MFS transporter [Burkholderiales bacterium]|nr:MFS transporter [Burkholderiales bacterium]
MTSNWRGIWAVFCGGLVAGAYMTKVPPVLPQLRAELGLSLVEATFIVTTFNVLGMLVGVLAGMLGDRYGRRRLALGGLALLAAGGAVGALAHDFTLLLASRFVEGVGFILFAVPAPALMSALSRDARERAKALSLWSAYMPTGGTLALLAAPLCIAAASWRVLWLVLAAAAVLAALVLARAVPAGQPARVASLRLVRESLARPGNIAMALLFACYVAQWTSVMVWLPTFLAEHGASTAVAASATALMVLVNAPGNLAGGWLLARGVPRGTLIIAASIVGALCELGMLAPLLPGALRYALVLTFSVCAGVIPASIFAGLPLHAPSSQHIATGNGMALQFSNLGQFFGPLAIAWIASRYGGWEAARWAMLAFAAAAAACGAALSAIENRMNR